MLSSFQILISQVILLNTIPFDVLETEAGWDEMFGRLKEYKNEHDEYVPS